MRDRPRAPIGTEPGAVDDPTRRSFLLTAASVGAVTALGGFWSAAPASAMVGSANWEIEAGRVEQTFFDTSVVPFFRFIPVGDTPVNGTLPLLEAYAGRPARLTITNTLDFPIQPTIVGIATGPVVKPGQTRTWKFQMPPVGTWLLTDKLLGPAAGPVGFGAGVVSRRLPATNAFLATNLHQPDREYYLLYQDADDRWNFAVDAGEAPDTALYEPNYHTVNGLTFPHTVGDPGCHISCNVGERVLIRMGNLGHVRQAIHFHGYHVDILSVDNMPETALGSKDTIPVRGQSTTDVLMPVLQDGVYPLHPHNITTVTDNGLYPGGQIVLIDAS